MHEYTQLRKPSSLQYTNTTDVTMYLTKEHFQ
jgi:hypothetical protein